MNELLFSGVCTALVTPFYNDQINYPMLEQLLYRQINAGIKAVVIAGTTGEASTLSDYERLTLFRKAKEYAGNTCMIIAGTGTNSTLHTVELSVAAEKTGANALLVVCPYYNKPSPDGIFAHYAAVSESVQIPFIVYNVPGRTGTDISETLYRRLCTLPNFAGIKEASSDITKITRTLALCGKDVPIWSGNDSMTTPVISVGGKGIISVLSNLIPKQVSAMTDAALDGDFDTAAFMQHSFQRLIDLLFCEGNPAPVKEALKIMGFDCGECRLPLSPISHENRKKLINELSALSLIKA